MTEYHKIAFSQPNQALLNHDLMLNAVTKVQDRELQKHDNASINESHKL